MAKGIQTKKKGPPELVYNEEDTPQKVNDSNTIPPILGVVTPVIWYEDTTVESLPVGNQVGILPPHIPDESSPPPEPLLPIVPGLHPSDPLKNPYQNNGTLDTQTLKSPPSEVSVTPVNKMIPTPLKANQTAIAILITINHHFFGFSLANCWSMAGMIGHIGSNEQTFGGEHFRYFTNLTSTWIQNSPLRGLNLWIVSINHDNDHLDTPFPTHTGFNYSVYMTFAKKIGRTGMVSKKINGAVHYSVCLLLEREETDLSTVIAQKAAERDAMVKAALLASAPTNQEMEDLFN